MQIPELDGDQLDYWIARALGNSPQTVAAMPGVPAYSRDFRMGGPLADRYRLCVVSEGEGFRATAHEDIVWHDLECGEQRFRRPVAGQSGQTWLVAVGRCLVARRFGRELPPA